MLKRYLLTAAIGIVASLGCAVPVLAQADTAWVRRYNGPMNEGDFGQAVAVDASGNVFVTGFTDSSGTSGYLTIKYDASGNELWTKTYKGPGGGADQAYAIALDDSVNVYVTGRSYGIGTDADYATVKYDSAGNQLWAMRYNGEANGTDEAYAIAVDSYQTAYVTGRSNAGGGGSNYDWATVKYDRDGTEVWVNRFGLGPGK